MKGKLFAETIILEGCPRLKEGTLTTTARPGMFIKLNGEDSFETVAAGDFSVARVVTENDLIGGTIQGEYAIGTRVYMHLPMKGDLVNCAIPANAPAIAVGDVLQYGANGMLEIGQDSPIAIAERAVDNSASADASFVVARII